MSDIQLTTAGKTKALEAIQAVHAAYIAKDGLRAVERVYIQRRQGTSAHIYSLAKWSARHSDTLSNAGELFCALCKHAEHEYKAAAGLTSDKYLAELRVWRVFKSQIRSCISNGISPLEHPTLHALKKATRDKLSRKKSKQRGPLTEAAVSHLFESSDLDSELADVLQHLVITAASAQRARSVVAVCKRALREVSGLQGKSEGAKAA